MRVSLKTTLLVAIGNSKIVFDTLELVGVIGHQRLHQEVQCFLGHRQALFQWPEGVASLADVLKYTKKWTILCRQLHIDGIGALVVWRN